MNLDVINEDKYYDFANNFFKEKEGSITKEAFSYAYKLIEGQTRYLQTILNRLYEAYSTIDDKQQIDEAINNIIDENTANYQGLTAMLTDNQLSLLQAIAMDGISSEPMSGDFIHRHHLKTASSVRAALKFLVNNELCYKSPKGYIVYDRFLGFWLRRSLH